MTRAIILNELLASIIRDALSSAQISHEIISRQYAAKGMLDSGNRRIAQVDIFNDRFVTSIDKIAQAAVEVVSPRGAAVLVNRYGRELQASLAKELDLVIDGKGSGQRSTEAVAIDLRQRFSGSSDRKIVDTCNAVLAGIITGSTGPKGSIGFLKKNGWSIVALVISVISLYLSATKRG